MTVLAMLSRRTLAGLLALATLSPARVAAQAAMPLSRIAFGSCADQAQPQPIWEAILAWRPDLFIFAGDNVYGDFKTADAANLKRAHALPATALAQPLVPNRSAMAAANKASACSSAA